MKNTITNNPEKCVGCNRCIRECPIEEANIAQEMNGSIIVKIDPQQCIACGACIAICPHGSRGYEDDTERFFNDLKAGVKISLFSAPALKTNFDEWGRVLSWLRKLGVSKIFDVSLGADICTWAHIRYLQKNTGKHIITQPCPAIVNYIVKHRNGLIERLSPIHSPMLCTAAYMRKYENINTKIAALSPCVAKSHEFDTTGQVDYNITFLGLHQYIENHPTVFPHENSGFDHYDSGLGFLYPLPGGLKENVEYYLGKSLRIDKSEGRHVVYKALDEYLQQPAENLPAIFDVLNCEEGCNFGTGCLHKNKSIFKMHTILDNARQKSLSDDSKKYLEQLYQHFDNTLHLEDFMRKYTPTPVSHIPVTQKAIDEAFTRLGKYDNASMQFNCGACGSQTCLEMAIKVAKGVNTPMNCMEKAHREISREHAESIEIQTANIKNLNIIMDDIVKIKAIMEEILSHMDDVTTSIKDFDQMTDDIQKIALQINIISMNASIEAARAGQHGRSFSVVAEEVRNLANKSKSTVQNSETASANASNAINVISGMMTHINKKINQAYDEVSLISESTQKIVDKS